MEPQREMLSLVTARVRDAYVRKPFYVDGALDLVSVCRELSQRGLTHALVQDGELAAGHLHHHRPARCAAARHAAERPGSARGGALRRRQRGRRQRGLRGAVADGAAPRAPSRGARRRRGAGRARATRPGEFRCQPLAYRRAADRRRHQRGRVAARGRAQRRDRHAAAWQRHPHRAHHAPGERTQRAPVRACLGADRTARTGGQQLPAGDGQRRPRRADPEDRPGQCAAAARRLRVRRTRTVAQRFQAALADFGYPPCPGGIMVSNPLWRQPLAAFRETLRGWLYGHDPEGPLRLAIFLDASPVAGDAACSTRRAAIYTASSPATTPTWRASPPRPTSSTNLATGSRG